VTRVAITDVAARGPYRAGTAPAEEPLASQRARKMMSGAAYLAACALAELVGKLAPSAAERAELGYFLGVGGSAGALDDVTALLDASFVDGAFSLPRFGDRGLAACNPLLAFQLMNNFTMCHGAILESLGGPNGALFSRGAGTIAALGEAHHAVRSGACARAIAGGADVATHPVTLAELARDGHLGRGLVPADGAALVALAASTGRDDVVLDGCAHASGRGRALVEALNDAFARALRAATSSSADTRDAAPTWAREDLDSVGHIALSAWGPPAAEALRAYAAARFPFATLVDVSTRGETLAGGTAFALIAAVELLRSPSLEVVRSARPARAVVLSLGVDGDPGVILLSRGGAA